MTKPKFDAATPDIAIVREVVLARLRREPDWKYIEDDAKVFAPFVDFEPQRGRAHVPR